MEVRAGIPADRYRQTSSQVVRPARGNCAVHKAQNRIPSEAAHFPRLAASLEKIATARTIQRQPSPSFRRRGPIPEPGTSLEALAAKSPLRKFFRESGRIEANPGVDLAAPDRGCQTSCTRAYPGVPG